MTYDNLISLCKPIDVSGPEPNTIGALTQDSRQVSRDDVFIAVRGLNADGHMFIDNAIAKGASVIICEKSFYTDKEVCVMEVNNTRSLIGPLAQAFEGNPAEKLEIIGITGTNGKTTVATLVFQVLQKLDAKPALLGTVAKHIGDQQLESRLTTSDPVELAADMAKMVKANATHLVMEVSSHALDQGRVAGIDFTVAAFTNLSHDHLDYHKDLKSYALSKKKLFDDLNKDGYAVVNGDDEQAAFIVMDCPAKIIDFSFKKALNIECQILDNSPNGLVIRIAKTIIESPLVGLFNAYNLTQAFLICQSLGFEDKAIIEALKSATGAAGRLERIEGSEEDHNPIVLVDYAHTPDALGNVLSTLAELKQEQQKLHVVFGCGGNRDKSKRPKMAKVAEHYADLVTVTSDNPRDEEPENIIAEVMSGFDHPDEVNQIVNREKAIQEVIATADHQTMILIAGKGHETYQEIKGQRYDFDDRAIAREALRRRNSNKKDGDS